MLLLIWAEEKCNTQKKPGVVFATQKNPLDLPPPPVIKICEWGPWDDNGGDAVGIDGDIGGDDNRVLKCDFIKN